ncbi:hypothetical protein CVM52_21475 [Pseudooceanicola lipolyticus]|uniref:DUF2927 domain-containing protein n=2 Tax=Pseudooceanicola lipolyticus TaxID=2029104 RepID=A0A2M8IVP4_9RHOB|nr:hypothetical protein CVM52_21475 [Pseudooceanicola lipolyticus]
MLAPVLAGALLTAGCEDPSPRVSLPPQARPAALVVAPAPVPPSPRSAELSQYYTTVQNNLLTQGLLRTDGGGPDTPFSADQLAEIFEILVFFEEYTRSGSANLRNTGPSGGLSRWSGPVRIGIEFGNSVPEEIRAKDHARITEYADRLARITNHPISTVRSNANFYVFVAGEDDTDFVQSRLRALIPTISQTELDLFASLPRSFYCLVVGVAGQRNPYDYARAVALIRSEHPDLFRLSCIHEEIAQGLGIPNDSPRARPSIFNDDDEFALLTRHDELLLQMLYDPRLTPGMTAEEARPIARIIARELMGEDL